jgi:TolB-like protein
VGNDRNSLDNGDRVAVRLNVLHVPSEESIRLHLQKVVTSRPFANTSRSVRFLRFIVEERLAGHLDRIQEYVLGLEVFDRKESFDPRIDSIVRVEGHRLRRRLEEYYRTDGRADTIRIELPRRGYIPDFRSCAVAKQRKHSLWAAAGALMLLLAGALAVRQQSMPAGHGRQADADLAVMGVLPFSNLSADSDQEYVADGMTDALITEMAKLQSVKVISRNSVMRFKGIRQSTQSIARELGARYLVEGAVSRSGSRVRLTVQLIDAATDTHIWAQSYDRELTDVFLLQSELVRQIAREIRVQLAPDIDRRLSEGPVVGAKALDAYLKGRFALDQRTGESAGRSAKFFEEAILEEPGFALAHAWVAAAYRTAVTMGNSPAREILPRATDHARKAVELAPNSSEAHSSFAVSLAMQWSWKDAQREFLTALELNPGDSDAHHRYAILHLVPLGRLSEAEAEIQTALDLDRTSLNNRVILAKILYFRRKYDEAVSELQEVLKMDPKYSDGLRNLGAVYLQQGRHSEAVAMYRKAQSLGPMNWGDGLLAHALAVSGNRRESLQIVQTLIAKGRGSSNAALAVATACIGLRAYEDAFRWLERALVEQDVRLMFVQADPIYDPLSSDLRFRKIAAGAGLVRPAELR